MAKGKKPNQGDELDRQRRIKELVIIAMFSDDELMERLVLKGGNAIDLLYRVAGRASVDVDFSIETDFVETERVAIRRRIEKTLQQTFRENGYEVFDVTMEEQPRGLTPDMADFWGGYRVELKLATKEKFEQFSADIEQLRRNAVPLGQGTKFSIDISKFEYTAGKQPHDLEGYRIFVYTPEMIVCEKLRAICQQMPEYAQVIKRTRKGSSRARDFFDIHSLITSQKIDIKRSTFRELVKNIFKAKRVPLSLLRRIVEVEVREFHRGDFVAVQNTVNPGTKLETFDFYVDFVGNLVSKLEPLGDE